MAPRSDTRTLLTVATLAVALRAPGLLSRPIWLDEWLTLDRARGQIGASEDWVPSTYAQLVGLLEALGAAPEAALRVPALLGAVLAVGLAAWAATAWGVRRDRWAAALMVACAAGFIPYGHEGRPYAWAVAGSFAVFAALGPQGPQKRAALVAAGALGSLWTWTGMATCAAFCGLAAKRDVRRAGWVGLGVAVAALPSVPALVAVPVAGLETVGPAVTPLQVADGVAFWWFGGVAARLPGCGVVLLLVGTWLARREPSELLAQAWVPLLVLCVAWFAGLHPMGPTRHLLVLAPPWVVLLCRVGAPPVWVGLSAAGAGFALAMAPGVPHHDVAPLVGQVGTGGVLHVDPVLQRSWSEAGGRAPDSGTWEQPQPLFDGRPLWVVERQRNAFGAPERVDVRHQAQATGVRLTVWLPRAGSTTARDTVLEAPR